MVMSKLVIDFYCFRKKYMRSCQIQHDYGEEDCNYNEDEALDLTSNAIRDGQAPPPPSLEYVERPEGASVNVGGKACKWCGSTTHTRRSRRDCTNLAVNLLLIRTFDAVKIIELREGHVSLQEYFKLPKP